MDFGFKLSLVGLLTLTLTVLSAFNLHSRSKVETQDEGDFATSHLMQIKKSPELLKYERQFLQTPFVSSKRHIGLKYQSLLKDYLKENPFNYLVWLELVEVQKYLEIDDDEREWVLAVAFRTGQWNKKFWMSALTYCLEQPYIGYQVCNDQAAHLSNSHPLRKQFLSTADRGYSK